MPRIIKPLTAAQVKNAKAQDKPYKLYDGGGLFLSFGVLDLCGSQRFYDSGHEALLAKRKKR